MTVRQPSGVDQALVSASGADWHATCSNRSSMKDSFSPSLVAFCIASLASTAGSVARAQDPPAPVAVHQPPAAATTVVVPHYGTRFPQHFEARGNQYYDMTVSGLRLRVDSLKTSDSATYAILDREVSRLETRRTAAIALFVGGLAAPLVGFGAGFIAQSQHECPPSPSVGNPNFEQASRAWHDCEKERGGIMGMYALVGMGVGAAGVLSALLVSPKRSDLLEVVNLHNRLTPEPIRWHFGYDPARRSASAGAVLSF